MEMISFLADDRSYLIQGGNAIRLTFEDIALRDMQKPDIEDYVRWFTTETKWNAYDAPWEPIEDSNEESQCASWREYYEWMKMSLKTEFVGSLKLSGMADMSDGSAPISSTKTMSGLGKSRKVRLHIVLLALTFVKVMHGAMASEPRRCAPL